VGGEALYQEKVQHEGGSPIPSGALSLGRSAEYLVDTERKMVTVKFRGKLTVGDIERYSKLLQANPTFQEDYSEVVDLTQVEELDLNANEFLKLADEIDPFSPDAKRAFIVRTSVQNHAARMHKVLRVQRISRSFVRSKTRSAGFCCSSPGRLLYCCFSFGRS
jgi:hypothetical protein